MATSGKDLSEKSFHNPETDFQLEVGGLYTVYGINMWQGLIHYLTFNKWGKVPFWTPSELFEIVDNRLPPEWYFNYYGYGESIEVNAVWGYKELALNQTHYYELINREGDSMDIFYERRMEIDQFHNS